MYSIYYYIIIIPDTFVSSFTGCRHQLILLTIVGFYYLKLLFY